jgi:hypothetical protein
MITAGVIIPGVKRKCQTCGTRFYPVQPTQKYCRPYCRLKAFRQRQKEGHDGKTSRG